MAFLVFVSKYFRNLISPAIFVAIFLLWIPNSIQIGPLTTFNATGQLGKRLSPNIIQTGALILLSPGFVWFKEHTEIF